MNENKKNIEVVNGDGSNLDISPVFEHINAMKPKSTDEKPKNIVIPKCVSKKSTKKDKKTNKDTNKKD